MKKIIPLILVAACSAGGGPYTYDNAKSDLELAFIGLQLLHNKGDISDEHWPVVEAAYVEAQAVLDNAKSGGKVDIRAVLSSAIKVLMKSQMEPKPDA